jgi:hypothetical protein
VESGLRPKEAPVTDEITLEQDVDKALGTGAAGDEVLEDPGLEASAEPEDDEDDSGSDDSGSDGSDEDED